MSQGSTPPASEAGQLESQKPHILLDTDIGDDIDDETTFVTSLPKRHVQPHQNETAIIPYNPISANPSSHVDSPS
jgi:hypothetical protein